MGKPRYFLISDDPNSSYGYSCIVDATTIVWLLELSASKTIYTRAYYNNAQAITKDSRYTFLKAVKL